MRGSLEDECECLKVEGLVFGFLGQGGGWACRHGREEASRSSVPQFLCSHMGYKRPLKSPRPTVSPSVWLGLGACLLGDSWGPGGL